METAYDWVSVLIFAGLVTQFLIRSAEPEESGDRLWHYLVPSFGCAAVNWAGNHGIHWLAVLLLLAIAAWVYHFFYQRQRSSPGS
ncbi:hypothetical protein HMF7854_11860 [Sphingomonas ginkgonis]|uniref:Uncharacterized protein n=1 Tax=Sphingomonas ginkgonis TaxID=2315330 RepID=A0A429VBX8_9SPHN|nr:XrtV sorting system accessory protein [Sphingomonas ginkgonis]RST31454.1 hypothetical protein HMF7854_11860 [Sphingomonas ginkgonis]